MRRSKPGAVGDAANAGSDKLDAAGVIGSRCKALAHATDPGGRLARSGAHDCKKQDALILLIKPTSARVRLNDFSW